MTFTKSSESPLQKMLKMFVDDQQLKMLYVSTFESALVQLLVFCHIELSALRIRFAKKVENDPTMDLLDVLDESYQLEILQRSSQLRQ